MGIKQLVQNKLKSELNQATVQTAMDPFMINDDRLDIIIELINQLKWSLDKKIDIITAIALLQLSLDTHQQVSNERDSCNAKVILHGDRLSCQYYVLIAKYDEVSLIHSLAVAIKEVNQLKIQLMNHAYLDGESYIKMKVDIELKLIIHLIHYLEFTTLEPFINKTSYNYLLEVEQERARINLEKNSYQKKHELDILHMKKQFSFIQLNNQVPQTLLSLTELIQIALKKFFKYQYPNKHFFITDNCL
ncbi:heptaprenyl diphosphate synthase component 1 [Amphibacillus sp. Q70]|uniref:heptaprenyl diphosphate synthase component 1 n=1 Tax=Amphibacillus sp. Q70 TaxID=3453416 RepID=UPI003F831301